MLRQVQKLSEGNDDAVQYGVTVRIAQSVAQNSQCCSINNIQEHVAESQISSYEG